MSRLLPTIGAFVLGAAALGLAAAPAAAANPERCTVEARLTTTPVHPLHNRSVRDAFFTTATYRCATPLSAETVSAESRFVFYDRRGRFVREADYAAGQGLVANRPGVLLAGHVACSPAVREQWRRLRVRSVALRSSLFRDGTIAADGAFRGISPVTRRTSGRVSVTSLCG